MTGPVSTPRPTAVRGNNWRKVVVPPLDEFVPTLPVTVVIPHYEAPDALALTLAALAGQTYPLHLIEVMVVDGGSSIPPRPPDGSRLDVKVIRREGGGSGLFGARNAGAEAASHDVLIFLDCGMMPEAGWLAAHARWHHVVSDALTLGFRAHVEADDLDPAAVSERSGSLEELFSDRPSDRPEWIEYHMARTNELTGTADDIFRVVTAGNLGVSKSFFEEVGGFDESFTQRAARDTEFGFRAYTRGGLLVPERRALSWRRGSGPASEEEGAGLDAQRAEMAHLIAHYGFRTASPGRSFTVPQVVVSVESGDAPVEWTFKVIERLLGDRFHDLVVRVEDRSGEEGFELIRRHFGPDPRVRFGKMDAALDDYPTASFHMIIPPGADPAPGIVYSLRAELGGAAQATVKSAKGARVSFVRTWALHRSRRSGMPVDQLGVRMSVRMGGLVPAKARNRRKDALAGLGGWLRSRLRQAHQTSRVFRGMLSGLLRAFVRIRSPREARQFFEWLAKAVRNRLASTLGSSKGDSSADYPLGAEIATIGKAAGAVLGASARVHYGLDERHVDLLIADRAESVVPGLGTDAAVVVLSEHPLDLSVPAMDARSVNPVGWRRDADGEVGALGPLEILPPGVDADRMVSLEDRDLLPGIRHIVDVAAFHPDPISRAGTLAALAATGVVVWLIDSDPDLEAALGADLYRLMRDDRIPAADPGERELLSVAMRREALGAHSLTARARRIIAAAPGLDPPPLPEVTVLAVAAHPELLPGLAEAVSRQTYPCIETVLILRGDRFGPEVEGTAAGFPFLARVVRVEDAGNLGSSLNRAVTVSRGPLITRMDDRNLYGSEHIRDLVLAREYSQAELVAKGAEFFYLAQRDRTVHLHSGQGEEFVTSAGPLAGGAMLIARRDLAAAGGWRRLGSGIGKALVEDVTAVGGLVYRTHGAGLVQVLAVSTEDARGRDSSFLRQAEQVWEGWRPERIGLDRRVRPVRGGRGRRAAPSSLKLPRERGPRPAAVQGNNWQQAGIPPIDEFTPTLPVSVVMPYYEAPRALELTLAALEGQTYPRDLFEVVVVDDGSRIPLRRPDYTDLDVKVVHQEDLGFGLARARNTGARAASHGILIFLDCDMMPEAGWLAAHARWHHAVSDALTLGFRAHVEVDGIRPDMVRNRPGSLEDLFSDRPSDRPEWIEFHMKRTDDLTSSADDLFRVVTGGNLGMSRAFFETVGGFDESFTQWGAEDTEFGYRAFTRGALLAPVREGFCWHQGVGAVPSEAEKRSLELQRAKIAHLIAHYGFRGAAAGRTFTVPQYAVTVQSGYAPVDRIYRIAERILGDRVHDLVIIIEDRPDDESFEWLRRELEPDPRVRFGPAHTVLDDFPISSFHVTVPPGADVGENVIHTLRNKLGSAVYGTLGLPDGSRVTITRTWALHRARRAGKSISEWGFTVSAQAPETTVGSAAAMRSRPLTRRLRRVGAKFARLLEELRRIRNVGQARLFVGWLAGAVGWRLHGARRYRRSRSRFGGPGLAHGRFAASAHMALFGGPAAGYPLGAEIVTLGPRSVSIFRTSIRVGRSLDGRTADLIVADGPGMAEEGATPIAYVSEIPAGLSVPAFDPVRINPIGWLRTPRKGVGALGPLGSLPAGSRADHTIGRCDRDTLRSVHHLEDVAGFHSDATTRASTLAALAGMGVIVHVVDHDPGLESRLGSELYGLMSAPDIREADMDERESISVRMRRVALREHSLRARARRIAALGVPDPPLLPEVSVLAVTKRPGMVPGLLATVSAQAYPRLELVLVLHGAGFGAGIEGAAADLGIPARVLRVDGRHRFGAVLNRAVSASGGDLLTKIDDDDLYSEEHIWDLVLAHEYSRAELVAKGAEFVYLAHSDRTIHRFCGKGEAASRVVSVAGGTMLISRHDLDAAGGWRRVPRGVDVALIEDVRRAGGRVYRTHGFGYVLVRHGEGHTWENDDSYFLRHAEGSRPGWVPEFAGLSPDTPPPKLAG